MSAPAPSLPLWRKLLYSAVLTAAAAALLLGGLELALRLAGSGYSPHFARRTTLPSGAEIIRENRWCTAPFFSPQLVRRPLPFRLPAAKPPGTYRLFVLGSSAAMGDPEPSFSFARVLEAMLRTAYPEIRFEVVNAAVTAINSHLARRIAADCAALSPDLFIVYEGHNEVIGPFGPAGVFTPFFRRDAVLQTAAWLKTTRTGQLLSAATRAAASRGHTPADWGGMQMFLQQQIAAADPRLAAVRAHFRANLLAIAASARSAGARTLLCTVLTNQRDFAPFLSLHRPDLSPADLARWDSAVAAGKSAQRTGDLAAAESAYRAALAVDDRHAELNFLLGRLLLQQDRDADARPLLQRALDLDALRFRTDSTINQTIRDLAPTTASTPASASDAPLEVVDLAAALAARSPHGIPGDDLLYEHVHLTFRGAYEIAAELFPRVSADLVRRHLVPAARPLPFDADTARVRLAFTAHDQAMIAIELLNRFRSPPFTAQADNVLRLATWQRRVDHATTLLERPEALPALRATYERALAAAPDDWILARNAGAMLVARHAPADAVPLLERAAAWIDDDVDTLVALGWAHRALGHEAASAAAFARARALEPRYPNLPPAPTSPP